MTDEQFADLLAQLRAIKLALTTAVVFVAVSAVLGIVRMYRYARQLAQKELGDQFRSKALTLLEKGRIEELVSHCEERLQERPNSVDAHWYLGRAHCLQERWEPALTAFEAVQRISPDWGDSAKPYLETIRSKRPPQTTH